MSASFSTRSYFDQYSLQMAGARAHSEALFEIVRPAAMYDRPIAERHRVIFYLGHLEAFDWNLFREPLGLSSFHPEFDRLFSFGIDPVEGGLPDDQPGDWPTVAQVRAYNARLRATLDGALREVARADPHLSPLAQDRLLNVAIEHRLMHAETLCYMLHQLPDERKSGRAILHSSTSHRKPQRGIEIPAGTATLGLARSDAGSFGWDNEFEKHSVDVPSFVLDVYNVTNQDYLRFTNEGGYQNRSLWTAAGWKWISAQNVEHPAFWVRRGNSWNYRAMFEEIPLPLNWPVYVSHDEASAYARWAGKELPSEAEWHRAACGTREGSERAYPWGSEQPTQRHGNFDMHQWDPAPVGSFPSGSSDFGVEDLAGNGWEWTRTIFEPFAGFEPFSFYPGYSENFFDGKHYVMKGGSSRTAACMLRRSFRNWFQPHYPYVYATFRCVER